MKNLKIFATSFLQVGLVCVNTVFVSRGMVAGIFVASIAISLVWSHNVAKIALSSLKEKVIYSFGAGFGAVCGYFLVSYF
jgi:hypothetical protein